MSDEKQPTADQRIAKLEQGLKDANWQIAQMQRMGGFADSKTLSMRSTRIEERLEKVELDGSMLKDFTGLVTDWMARHLHERHGISEHDNAPDSIFVRKVRRRLAEWAEKCGLMGKRRDVAGARNDENRLRPQQQAADS
jgi:hypothetical protein